MIIGSFSVKKDTFEMTWQPITNDSPPWDGTPVLVWSKHTGIWISARKTGLMKNGMPTTGYNWYLNNELGHYPTHWMPLPEPPE